MSPSTRMSTRGRRLSALIASGAALALLTGFSPAAAAHPMLVNVNPTIFFGQGVVWYPDTQASAGTTTNGATLRFQTDGNLVLYQLNTGNVLWASNTAGTGANEMLFPANGPILLERNHRIITEVGPSSSAKSVKAVVQADQNFVFYDVNDNATWATRN